MDAHLLHWYSLRYRHKETSFQYILLSSPGLCWSLTNHISNSSPDIDKLLEFHPPNLDSSWLHHTTFLDPWGTVFQDTWSTWRVHPTCLRTRRLRCTTCRDPDTGCCHSVRCPLDTSTVSGHPGVGHTRTNWWRGWSDSWTRPRPPHSPSVCNIGVKTTSSLIFTWFIPVTNPIQVNTLTQIASESITIVRNVGRGSITIKDARYGLEIFEGTDNTWQGGSRAGVNSNS